MPGYPRSPEAAIRGLLLFMLMLAGCSGAQNDSRFELSRAETAWSNGRLDVRFEQRITLSEEARNALVHGVPLTIELELRLRSAADKTRVREEKRRYEISYLPLSDHYQLTDQQIVRTFPRLRHVLAELADLNVSLQTGVLPAGEYELLVRTRLDRERMPPPMRLPVLLSAKWKHDTDWSSWPLQIEPEA